MPPTRKQPADAGFRDYIGKLRQQREAEEFERLRKKLAARGSEADRYSRGDAENAKAIAVGTKALTAMQVETAQQRQVCVFGSVAWVGWLVGGAGERACVCVGVNMTP